MSRYEVTIEDNAIVDVTELDDDEEEYLGIEWAVSEIRDSYRHNKTVDGSFTLDGPEELAQLIDFVEGLLGEAAVANAAAWRGAGDS